MGKQGKPHGKNPTPKRDRKNVQMLSFKRLSQNHKYNETPHNRSVRLHSPPRMVELLCRWTYQCGPNSKETKVVDRDDKTHVYKV